MNQIVLLCGVPYCGKSTFLKDTQANCLKIDDFLMKRYDTDDPSVISIRLSQDGREKVINDIAEMAVSEAKQDKINAPFFIEGMFTLQYERMEMVDALKKAGADKIDCVVLLGVPILELVRRQSCSKKKFKCTLDTLIYRCDSFEEPSKSDGFDEIIILKYVDKQFLS